MDRTAYQAMMFAREVHAAQRRSQLSEGRRPSAKQVETLDNIWERATKRG